MSATPSRLSNYTVKIPGTSCVARLGNRQELDPGHWFYTLWDEVGISTEDPTETEEQMIAQGSMDLDGLTVTPEQVARVAFLLECEYAPVEDVRGPAGEGTVEWDFRTAGMARFDRYLP